MTVSLVLVSNNQQPQKEAYKRIEQHFREHYGKMVSRLTNTLKSKERAEDTVSEAFLRACHYWHDAPPDPTDFARWFSGVLSNSLKDNHREEILKGATNDREEENGEEGPAIPAIILRQVRERIEAKPEGQARILQLALLQQCSPRDIEALVPETGVTIRKTISRFRREIKDVFGFTV